MKKAPTHTANVILNRSGKVKKVKCYEGPETWVVGKNETYYKRNGFRTGGMMGPQAARLDLSSLAPIGGENV